MRRRRGTSRRVGAVMRGLFVAGMVLAALGQGAYAADASLPVKAPPQQSQDKLL